MDEPRFKLRFRSRDALKAALAVETVGTEPVLINEKRGFVAFEPAPRLMMEAPEFERRTAMVAGAVANLAREFEAEIVVDYQYELEPAPPAFFVESAPEAAEASLKDVIEMIKAKKAWQTSRGAGVTIAIVDTGIHGDHKEFAPEKRSGGWALPGEDPWTDYQGHGTMCACIAAGTTAHGGRYNGVAPEAKIMACRTKFYDSEVATIYDALTARAKKGERIVASNSFGRKTGFPPDPDPNSDFLPALGDAVAAGVVVVFSAGNNHELAGGSPDACSPNSVWLHKSRADVLAVATCRLDRSMWYYSSRGPGQHWGMPNTSRKPDVTAPTPRNGQILYGSGESVLANGWGTSGACPQVAGLAALLISADPGLTVQEVYDRIRNASQPLGFGQDCEGHGLIDCGAAFAGV
jgi:serine protease AprX